MRVSTRWTQRTLLAVVVTGALGFGTAAAVAAPAKRDPFYCGVRPSGEACKNCCLGFGFNQGGYWNPDNGRCWCANPD